MDDFIGFNYDIDGDGILDSYADEVDLDGDGMVDAIDLYTDVNGDGQIDAIISLADSDGDGYADAYIEQADSDGDGIIDMSESLVDSDGDSYADAYIVEQLVDSDGDGHVDTYVYGIDEGADGSFDMVESYDLTDDGYIEVENIDDDGGNYTYPSDYDDFENYSSEVSDPRCVVGDPEASMEGWDFQGNTNRCALYSQMFIIEELTGQDIDIEEMADIAEENGWFTEEGGTPCLDLNKMLEYYGVENEMSFNNHISDIEDCLADGGKVIVSIDAYEIWDGDNDSVFNPGEAANHAVEVIGIDYSDPDNPMIILNDSGHPDGCGSMIPLEDFEDAWEDGGCQMVACVG